MKQYSVLFSIVLGLFSSLMVGSCFANQQIKVNVQLGIIHGFSGSLGFTDEHYFDGIHYYTAASSVGLELTSSTPSEFTLVGDSIQVGSGTVGSGYATIFTAPLLGGDKLYQFHASFIDATNQRVESNTVSIIKDTIAPSQVDQLSIQVSKAAGNTGLFVSWNASIDTSSGIKEYQIVFATDNTFINSTSFSTTNTSLVINEILIPPGYTFIKILAIDNVGNISQSLPVQFSPEILYSSTGRKYSLSPSNSVKEYSTKNEKETEDENNRPALFFIPIQPISPHVPKQSVPLQFDGLEPIQYIPSGSSNIQSNTTNVDTQPLPSFTSPGPGVRGIKNSQKEITSVIMCSDEQCVEIHDTGTVCDETVCLEYSSQIERLHYVASSEDPGVYDALIEYHKQLTRRLYYMLILLFYSTCYDIELHLRRRDEIYGQNR